MKLPVFLFILMAFSAFGAEQGTDSKKEREVGIVYISWFNPVYGGGGFAGCGYRNNKNSADRWDFLLPIDPVPEKVPPRDSPAGKKLIRDSAERHLALMKGIGADILYYDFLPIPDYDPAKPLDSVNEPFSTYAEEFPVFIEAAGKCGLQVVPFADVGNQSSRYPVLRFPTEKEWVNILSGALKHLPDSPVLKKENGRQVIMHFGTDCTYDRSAAPAKDAPLPDGGWSRILRKLRELGTPVYFIADIRPSLHSWKWDGLADAAYIFSPASPLSFLKEHPSFLAGSLKIPFFWMASPGNYQKGRTYTEPDFARIHETYMGAMKADAKQVVILTWNDMNEDHNIWPSMNKGSELLKIFRYYNRWFKSGTRPDVEKEQLIIAYPLRSPERITSYSSSFWTRLIPDPNNPKRLLASETPYSYWEKARFSPKVFYWSNLKTPRNITLGGIPVRLPAGLYFHEVVLDTGIDAEKIPLSASVDGHLYDLPPIRRVKVEWQDGGLEHRYIDLLAEPAFDILKNAARKDVTKNKEASVFIEKGKNNGSILHYTFERNIHNWGYLRYFLNPRSVSPECRFLRIAYKGNALPGCRLLAVIQLDGKGESYQFLLPDTGGGTKELLIPLNHFVPAAWGPRSGLKIPDVRRCALLHIGIAGKTVGKTAGVLSVEDAVFLK